MSWLAWDHVYISQRLDGMSILNCTEAYDSSQVIVIQIMFKGKRLLGLEFNFMAIYLGLVTIKDVMLVP